VRAAARDPLDRLPEVPAALRPPAELVPGPAPAQRARPERVVHPVGAPRTLGGVTVSALALSGAGELPVASYGGARAAGVNTFFWEPRHVALGQYLRGRKDTVVIAGSYHAAGPAVLADVERALRRLRRDTLDVFLLFWARSPARLAGDAFEVMDRLKRAGKIRAAGFSTHLRDLACDALAAHPWDVVMTRLSAAHPGAATRLLPEAAARGAGVIAFSALCYGRLLPGADAADCYRWALSQPAVATVLSAPRRHRELEENLAVLERPTLDAARATELASLGERVRADGRRWGALVREAGVTREEARAQALAQLDADAPPELDSLRSRGRTS
jgi:diketogulonate reductase-like aldo/keto reductase